MSPAGQQSPSSVTPRATLSASSNSNRIAGRPEGLQLRALERRGKLGQVPPVVPLQRSNDHVRNRSFDRCALDIPRCLVVLEQQIVRRVPDGAGIAREIAAYLV